MIRYVYAEDLNKFPILAESMFKDRARQFRDRLNWDVTVSEYGWERDDYDDFNPLYVIWENADGTHGGSMRTLPTLGRCMTNEHFRHLTDGVTIASPTIWECTRYCLAPEAGPKVAAALLLAGCEMGLRFGLTQALGVFDARMPRIYGRIGWSPDVIGTEGSGRDAISVGLWTICEAARDRICERSGLSAAEIEHWFDLSFSANLPEEQAEAA